MSPRYLLLLLLVAGSAWANPPEGKGHGKGHKQEQQQQANLPSAGISAADAHALVRQLGLDVSGYQSLPPGIRKNLARGKPLPPGIAKRMAPQPLRDKLPVYDGYDWKAVGRDLVLVSVTGLVADVLRDVLR